MDWRQRMYCTFGEFIRPKKRNKKNDWILKNVLIVLIFLISVTKETETIWIVRNRKWRRRRSSERRKCDLPGAVGVIFSFKPRTKPRSTGVSHIGSINYRVNINKDPVLDMWKLLYKFYVNPNLTVGKALLRTDNPSSPPLQTIDLTRAIKTNVKGKTFRGCNLYTNLPGRSINFPFVLS